MSIVSDFLAAIGFTPAEINTVQAYPSQVGSDAMMGEDDDEHEYPADDGDGGEDDDQDDDDSDSEPTEDGEGEDDDLHPGIRAGVFIGHWQPEDDDPAGGSEDG